MSYGMGISKAPFQVAGKVSYYYKIDGRRLSLQTDKLTEAKRRLAKLRAAYFEGKLSRLTGAQTSALTVGAFVEEYMEWAMDTRPTKTWKLDQTALRRMVAVTGSTMRLTAVTARHADELKRLKLKPASINAYLRHLRAIFGKAQEWGHIQANPFKAVALVPQPKAEPLYIQPREVTRFLASIEDIDARRIITAYIYTGRRRGELVALDWRDVNMDREEYTIQRAKRHLTKTFSMHPIFRAVLRAIGPQPEGRVFSRWAHPDSVTHAVKTALRGYGLHHVHLHHMRHTFAVLLREEGVDLKTIGDLMGHTDTRATECYAHITDTAAANALRKIKGGPVEL